MLGIKKWLKKKLKLKFISGIPSKFTIERVISGIDAKKFEAALINWSESIRNVKYGDVIAIDGKTSKGSRSGLEVLHCVNAWSRKNGITLGQVATAAKSNEITAIPELIRLLDIKGAVVTIDAMGCQKSIAAEIIDNGADYFLALKGNQGIFYKEVSAYLNQLLDSLSEEEKLNKKKLLS